MTQVVVVTGATGFLGLHLVPALMEKGWDVHAVSRRPFAWRENVQHHVADIADRNALRRVVEGADAVVHLAARVHVMHEATSDPMEAFATANVEGTRVLLESCIATGVRRFIYMSSVKAMGEVSDGAWTEDTPAVPLDPYGRSKYEAELLVREAGDRGETESVILRLPMVYGAGVKGNMLRLLRLVDRGMPLPVKIVENRRSMLFVGNLVAAIETLIDHPAAVGELFLVSDGPPISTPDLVRELATALGKTPRLFPLPLRLVRLAGGVGDLLSRVVPFPLTSAAVGRVLGNLEIDSRKLSKLTGFQPPFSTRQGLQVTAEWYKTDVRGRTA